ncbi:MAG: heavy-metal-associated domain-containing protein [Actinobacteria bacterium]|nr:heavy-metal-associated domain-containing protein [Actinomycetota bacterium]
MNTTTFTVVGMTCGHCVGAVREELSKIVGVTDVDVDLDSGTVTVTSATELDQQTIDAAVDEAGYEVAR